MIKYIRLPILLALLLTLGSAPLAFASAPATGAISGILITNAAQFWSVSPESFLAGCGFRLRGAVTLVDTNRDFLVLQDETGAVGIHCRLQGLKLHAGDFVSLESSNCSPALAKFPAFPHRPSGWQIRRAFEAPINWGEYHLTRMRGYLHPPTSGQYTFWISSDNSSELWLSTDAERSKMRKIASVARYQWTLVREWTKFPSQRSESIWLNAGDSYYIEALQEQTGGGDNLAVAWQGPDLKQSVIEAKYLTPWSGGHYAGTILQTNGILHEYWTNYSAGDLTDIGGPRPFQSALSVDDLRVVERSENGRWPLPYHISAAQPWNNQNNYRWADAEGTVKFASEKGDNILVQLEDGTTVVQVRALNPWANPSPRIPPNAPVRIRGVCEATYDEASALTPGLIWATTGDSISMIEKTATNSTLAAASQPSPSAPIPSPSAMGGFYATRGVVTFCDHVFGKDCLFVQEGNAAMFVSLESFAHHNPLAVGKLLDLGGALETDKSLPIITPLVFTEIGWRALPTPNTEPIQVPISADRDGKWTELEGVVHGVNSNGTLSVMGPHEACSVWLGGTATNELAGYVDAKLRMRGVLSLTTLPIPVLLVPSQRFVEVDERARDAFSAPLRSIADLKTDTTAPELVHRVRLIGEVTLKDAGWFYVQDKTGGIRVQAPVDSVVNIGQAVEVVGFPAARGVARVISEAVIRAVAAYPGAKPVLLDLTDGLPARLNGSLIRAEATLLKARTIGNSQILELQRGGRIFTSTLFIDEGRLNDIAPGSQVEITGVCDTESGAVPPEITANEKAALASLNIWLRSPGDLHVLAGPPWWTWKRAALLVGTLLTILTAALLWVYFLRRRLERQQALQLAFSQQVLERLEDERRRIAANLHDGLGQVLLAIRNQTLLAMQRNPEPNGVRPRLEEISDATSQALEEVRQITQGLRPYQLNRLGLTQAIKAALNQVSSDRRIVFASRVDDVDKIFDEDSEIHVYRIVQEAINNVIKHSSANEAAVVIKHRTNTVSISVRDNGRGFDTNSLSSGEPKVLGYGLTGIAERVRILRGTLTIDSRPGKGTNMTVEIPIPVRNHEKRDNHIDR